VGVKSCFEKSRQDKLALRMKSWCCCEIIRAMALQGLPRDARSRSLTTFASVNPLLPRYGFMLTTSTARCLAGGETERSNWIGLASGWSVSAQAEINSRVGESAIVLCRKLNVR
jgi:hypothetical protein